MMHRCLVVIVCLALVAGCGGRRHAPPAWVDGVSPDFPSERFLVGVGQADSQAAASERAYGAVAKIFRAQVTAQSRDWESYVSTDRAGQSSVEHRVSLDQLTTVSTDKALENVKVLDRWMDTRTGQHYALAGMDRAQAGSAMAERIDALDRTIETELAEAARTADTLGKVRSLRRAINDLLLREVYNTDLRVIRPSGQGLPSVHRVADLKLELERTLAERALIAIEITGDEADQMKRALAEGLIREGLSVAGLGSDGHTDGVRPASAGLRLTGTAQLWEVSVPDPRFRYARWCGDFVLTDVESERVVGAVSLGGREGHITTPEAMARAFRVMQQELSTTAAKALAGSLYGETPLPADLPPAACPTKESSK
ncbi:LPP20 family lipoprotein [Candidatus Nitrospira bockiana]